VTLISRPIDIGVAVGGEERTIDLEAAIESKTSVMRGVPRIPSEGTSCVDSPIPSISY
jgi:hypothetical protein